jgi:tRNA (cmo5U34)-methyltransferase
VADFRAIPAAVLSPKTFDLVISSYALHHLDARDKRSVLDAVVPAMRLGGWFVNADIVRARAPQMEARIQEIRVRDVTRRAAASDPRFESPASTRRTLDELEAAECDQPQTLDTDLSILRDSGLEDAEVVWREYREAVLIASRPLSR